MSVKKEASGRRSVQVEVGGGKRDKSNYDEIGLIPFCSDGGRAHRLVVVAHPLPQKSDSKEPS